MRNAVFIPIALALVTLSGCRFKGVEGFNAATTPNPPTKGDWHDPYAFGGIGDANGGLQPKTRYGTGAKTTGTGPIDVTYDQPAYGTGNQIGENPGQSAAGYGRTNSPAMQDRPGAYQSSVTRSSRG